MIKPEPTYLFFQRQQQYRHTSEQRHQLRPRLDSPNSQPGHNRISHLGILGCSLAAECALRSHHAEAIWAICASPILSFHAGDTPPVRAYLIRTMKTAGSSAIRSWFGYGVSYPIPPARSEGIG